MKKIVVLGSTGSIGCQTLDIVRAFPDEFALFLLGPDRQPLFSTSDPLGADALFVICVDGTSSGLLSVFEPTIFTPPDELEIVVPSGPECFDGPETLCLNNERFKAEGSSTAGSRSSVRSWPE